MNERVQLWIGVSNREESMARVLSRADFNEGTVLHAHRAASAALTALFANRGWPTLSDRCDDLCRALEAHEITPPQDVRGAATALDAATRRLDPGAAQQAPSDACTAAVAASCLDAVNRVRSFVNTVLTKS